MLTVLVVVVFVAMPTTEDPGRQAGRDMDLDLKLLRMYHSLHYRQGNIPSRK